MTTTPPTLGRKARADTMTLGYNCPIHGFEHDCDVNRSGHRVCNQDGKTHVTGITGSVRFHDQPTRGKIEWVVTMSHGERSEVVRAFDAPEAFDEVAALDGVDPIEIQTIKPLSVHYRVNRA